MLLIFSIHIFLETFQFGISDQKIDIIFFINFVLFAISGLTNLTWEKLVLLGFSKPHTIKATLQNLIYAFILNKEKSLKR